jgi:hypothetical protein
LFCFSYQILKRHRNISPHCNIASDAGRIQGNPALACTEDSGSNGEVIAELEAGAVRCERKKTSVSDLEENVVCDTDSDTVEDIICDTKSKLPNENVAGAVGGRVATSSPNASAPNPQIAIPWDPRRAKYPYFIEKCDRLASLGQSWDTRGCSLSDIADAGLVQLGGAQVTGTSGSLFCFFCGVSVPGLQRHDDAWIEHAMRSPDCGYVRHKKGQDYLKVIIDIYLDGDMEAVNRAVEAVAALKGPDLSSGANANNIRASIGTISANSVRSDASYGASGASFGATGSSYDINGSSYRATRTTSSNSKNVASYSPRTYRGGLRGGDPSYAKAPSSSVSSQNPLPNIPVYRPGFAKGPSSNISSQNTSNNIPVVAIPKSTISKPIVRKPRIPKRQVQAREVRARLDTDGAQRVISMGYSSQLVGAVLAEQLIFNGDDFKSFTEMMMAVFEADEMGDAFPAGHYDLGLNNSGKTIPAMSKGDEPSRPQSPPKSPPAPAPVPSPATPGDLKSLQIENDRLMETKTCTVCMDQERDVLFVPCGHLVVCHKCSPRLQCCPLCRQKIQGIVQVFLS